MIKAALAVENNIHLFRLITSTEKEHIKGYELLFKKMNIHKNQMNKHS